ncbi:hypothetical protein DENIT_20062 [Pseudomonas veronii]|uniref:hypothetical protein n=1 Tax=Pseudomonas veronii TaxID=76761 RepID=UPI0017536013|nr:hypothetical protein [Pseudomonas veronii]CAD0264179.1 hypothetical protein DENIT_20062 [Pseudomonas veronii]
MTHPIPKWLREQFDSLEMQARKLGGEGVFTQMRTKVQAYFMHHPDLGEPVLLRFPTMLRKMWSGGEVQAWLDELGPLYRHADSGEDEIVALRAQLAEQATLLTKMKALFRVDDPFNLYDEVCSTLSASAELSTPACGYSSGDWECRQGGYLYDAGSGEGYDPSDCTYICPKCRTKDFLESAKEDAEGCSHYSNNGTSGTGLDIWKNAERQAIQANPTAAIKALSELGPVEALDDETVVLCNTQRAPDEWDDRAEFERAFDVRDGVFFSSGRKEYRPMNGRPIEWTDARDLNLRMQGWQAHAALERVNQEPQP